MQGMNTVTCKRKPYRWLRSVADETKTDDYVVCMAADDSTNVKQAAYD